MWTAARLQTVENQSIVLALIDEFKRSAVPVIITSFNLAKQSLRPPTRCAFGFRDGPLCIGIFW
jgi:hypothetical protein